MRRKRPSSSARSGLYSWVPSKKDSLPVNAVEAGIQKGNKIFIARAYHGRSLIPGRFSVPERMTFIWGPEGEIGTFNYEILTASAGRVKWMDYDSTVSAQLPGNAVEGGFSESFGDKLYIGRCHYSGSTLVGYVHVNRRNLSVYFEGRVMILRKNFQILVTV